MFGLCSSVSHLPAYALFWETSYVFISLCRMLFQHYPHWSHGDADWAHRWKCRCCCRKALAETAGGTVSQMSRSPSFTSKKQNPHGWHCSSLFQKWESVKLLFVKTERSVSLPVFSSFVSCQGEAQGLRARDLLKKVSRSSYPGQASSCL